jgi:hypothetical protein
MTAARQKTIRIFWSPLSQRFYATRSYRDAGDGLVTVGSNNDDVTNDIVGLIKEHRISIADYTLREDEP